MCIVSYAQDKYNCVDINLNNVVDIKCVPCEKQGYCVIKTYRFTDSLKVEISKFDTLMQTQMDTSFFLIGGYNMLNGNYEHGEIAILFKNDLSRKLSVFTIVTYGINDKLLRIREIENIIDAKEIDDFHHFSGNLIFSTKNKNSEDKLWFLPNESSELIPFDFNNKFRMRVLDVISEMDPQQYTFCLSADSKTFFFQTDVFGKINFANIISENSTSAFINKISNKHYLLSFNEKGETFLKIRVAEVFNNSVETKSRVEYSLKGNLRTTTDIEQSLTSGRLLSTVPQNAHFSQIQNFRGELLMADVVDVYLPEYQQYYNGYYYDTRIYGYRYQYAKVNFYDTNGIVVKSLTVPFNDSQMLHTETIAKTKVAFLNNEQILLYYMDSEGFTTQLLNEKYEVIDPARSSEIPLRSKMFKHRNAEVDIFTPWYGNNYFLIGAIQYSKDKKIFPLGYIINKLKFE